MLLARQNFGCGSSREHAPWALDDFGIRCVIAPGFAEIFYNNCFKNGLLPVVLSEQQVDQLFGIVENNEGYRLAIDLERQVVVLADGQEIPFTVDEFRRDCLLRGLDDIGLTLQESDAIKAFEQKHKESQPWLFSSFGRDA